jgi:hypothetical protein
MRTFTLDASEWRDPVDFYDSILPLLEAPHWHGVNMNALVDSMFYGGINGVDPPYKIWIKRAANLPENVKTEIGWLAEAARDHGGAEKGILVQIDP